MFGLFSPRCPLDAREKTWVELRMQWLIDRLGFEKLRTVEVLTPSDRHFPDAYHGSDEDIERIFDRACDQIGFPRELVQLELFDRTVPPPHFMERHSSPLGLYHQCSEKDGKAIVWIEYSQAADPMQLVATVAHELAHCVLLGENLLTGQETDHEFVTDLLPVVRGMGIFLANATLAEQTHGDLLVSWWSMSRNGYLPSRMFGYALAVFAWLRGEERPDWARHLRGDALAVLNGGLKYLHRTRDSRCQPPGSRDGIAPSRVVERLSSGSSGIHLAALWELRRPGRPELAADEWAAVVAGLDCRDALIVCEAALTIAALNRPDSTVVEKCLRVLHKHWGDSALRSAIALVLGTQQDRMDLVIDELAHLLDDESPRVVMAALTALRKVGPIAGSIALPQMMQVFRRGLLACDELLLRHLVSTLRAVCEAPQKTAATFFEDDPELRMHAHDWLRLGIDETALFTTRLPTTTSLPVPLPDWRPAAPRFETQPHPDVQVVRGAPDFASQLKTR